MSVADYDEVTIIGRLPNRDDIERFAEGLSDEYLNCRAWGHMKRMRAHRMVRYSDSPRVFIEGFFHCLGGCNVTWVKVFDPDNGMPVYEGHPRYPRDYLAKGIGPIVGPARGIVKLEVFKRSE